MLVGSILLLPKRLLQSCNDFAVQTSVIRFRSTLERSEFCNTLLLYLRKKLITPDVAIQIINAAENLIGGNELKPKLSDVLQLALDSQCTFYDCEFVAAAKSLATILVTEDKALLKAFPDEAFSLSNALKRR